MGPHLVIVGAGMAAYSLAREFRKLDRESSLLIISADSGAAYSKPMLSNALALGKAPAALVQQDAAAMGAQLNAHILTRTRVTGIDTAVRQVHAGALSFSYSKLVLALGADPIRLPLEGDAAAAVISVNHLDDYARLRQQLDGLGRPAHVAILGAGLIGCEFADDLLASGHRVTMVDPNSRPLSALAAPGLSEGLRQAWSGKALSLKLGTVATSVRHHGTGYQVLLANGERFESDIVLSAVGLRPATALARETGLLTQRGILVDSLGATSAPDVYALGDCAEYATPQGNATLPYVAPLLAAARSIAATISGTPTPIPHKPDAVVVKTPSYKMALSPPPPGTAGNWHEHVENNRTIARFVDQQGIIRGVGLSDHTPALRQSLLAMLGSGA
jgi:rubredoxin-NAD+ reductase